MHRFRTSLSAALVGLSPAAPSLLANDRQPAPDEPRVLWTAQWNHDGSRFAVGGEHTLWVYDADTLERRSLLSGAPEARRDGADPPYMAVTHVAWHPTRDVLAVSSQGANVVGIYDADSGDRTALPPMRDNAGRGVSWNPAADRVAISSPDDGHLRIYTREGALLHDVPRFEDAKGLTGVAWSPRGDRIVTIGSRITLHEADGTPISQWMHRPEASQGNQLLLSVAWHPSGEFFVTGDYGTEADDPVVQLWSGDGDLLRSVALEGDTEIRNIAWSPDARRFATASARLIVWTEDGEIESEADAPDLLWGVSWHPGGDTILTSDIVGRITLWDDRAGTVERIR